MIVVARHTCIDAKQIYDTLKPGGKLLLRGVDKSDCWSLKLQFGQGQAFKDDKPISLLENTTEKGILLIRRYYGITAIK